MRFVLRTSASEADRASSRSSWRTAYASFHSSITRTPAEVSWLSSYSYPSWSYEQPLWLIMAEPMQNRRALTIWANIVMSRVLRVVSKKQKGVLIHSWGASENPMVLQTNKGDQATFLMSAVVALFKLSRHCFENERVLYILLWQWQRFKAVLRRMYHKICSALDQGR